MSASFLGAAAQRRADVDALAARHDALPVGKRVKLLGLTSHTHLNDRSGTVERHDALAGEYDGRATVAKLNVDENPNVPTRFMIRGIPTLLIFKNGQLAETLVGLSPKEDIARLIEKHL